MLLAAVRDLIKLIAQQCCIALGEALVCVRRVCTLVEWITSESVAQSLTFRVVYDAERGLDQFVTGGDEGLRARRVRGAALVLSEALASVGVVVIVALILMPMRTITVSSTCICLSSQSLPINAPLNCPSCVLYDLGI